MFAQIEPEIHPIPGGKIFTVEHFRNGTIVECFGGCGGRRGGVHLSVGVCGTDVENYNYNLQNATRV